MLSADTNSSLNNPAFELAPFKGGVGLLIWFLLPGLFVGALLYQVVHYDVLANPQHGFVVWFASWLDENDNHLLTLFQSILVLSTVHYLTTSAKHRWSSLIFAILIAALCVSLQWYSTERFVSYGDSDLKLGGWPLYLSWSLTIVIGAIAIPFYRTIFQHKQSFFHYPSLFEFAWNQSVVLMLAGLFIGLVMTLIAVADALFKTIGIDVGQYIWDGRVLSPIIGAAFAVGIGISRQYENVIHALVGLIIGLFRAILPIQLLIVLVFIGFTLLSGYDNFDNERELKLIFLVAISISLTLCTAAVGNNNAPISRWLGGSWRLMSAASLCLSLVAVYLVVERIKSYGHTHVHSLAGILTIIGLLYCAGYAISALLRNHGRDGVKLVNVLGALVVLVLAIGIQTPTFDLVRHAASTQLTRIKEEGAPVPDWKLLWLQHDAGAAGQKVLDDLYAEAALELPSRLELQATSRYRYNHGTSEGLRSDPEPEPDYWQDSIDEKTLKVRFGALSENIEWTEELQLALTRNFTFKRNCLEQKNTCRVFITDEIIPNVYMAVVVIRIATRTGSIDWYRFTDGKRWVGGDDNARRSKSNQFRIIDEDALDQLIEDIDSGQAVHKPIEINAITLDGDVFYPPWDILPK